MIDLLKNFTERLEFKGIFDSFGKLLRVGSGLSFIKAGKVLVLTFGCSTGPAAVPSSRFFNDLHF